MNQNDILKDFILRCLDEDIGEGDVSSSACIPPEERGRARLIVKENCVIAGLAVVRRIYSIVDESLSLDLFINDGDEVQKGTIGFIVSGNIHSILKSERLVLNILQRMSGIATVTRAYVKRLEGLKTKVTDTRKTTPGMRFLEKEAVRIGGGENHRMGLYDMIMLKDNHIDYAGGIENAIARTKDFIKRTGKNIKIEIEARNLDEVKKILATGGVDRIMLDNFSVEETRKAVELVAGRYETESSGGINLDNVRSYAECGVDYVSVGALTHHLKSIDMSLKALTSQQ
ncbi:MAG TPA: carboxylating nicotinate-nucleotide diphosphorylase [Bacteroidales bacterium]|nr:carboxylating nicotinate-nucleotide diphosphorylase [Bacteroidales bacterium]HOK73543.1 carboxylating nicotinate-nucleotide diphosphorylase [Bacteroidales bacterium]HOM39799.1 carboxylating nicotinate-nucleotide diphosphorylase [Bacteroidales bacterium]HPP91355.1 carboxylating nicotinate-nucleotide diphosphorylase [Bacteroidales bacterium]HRR15309.1 carboxylating nicotinate-nucleotide diphosphorylase [Bacteroidales bacterium]